jgi:lipoate-protein ligase A
VAAEGAVDLHTAAGREIPEAEVVDALCAGFRAALGAELEVGTLTEAEERRAQELVPEYAVLSL